MGKQRGFTLIELMVTVAILGILVAVAAPSFTESLARRSLEGAANELNADLQYAKTQAVSVNTAVQLATTADGSGYTVGTAATPAAFKTMALGSKFTLTASTTVTFEPYRAFPAAVSAITVARSGTSSQIRVGVDAKGRVQMCTPSGSFGGYPTC